MSESFAPRPGQTDEGPTGGGQHTLIVDCVELRQRPGNRAHAVREVVLDGLEITAAQVVGGELTVDVSIESVFEGVVAQGRVLGAWLGECRRCLEEVGGPLDLALHEVFESSPTEGETWPLVDDRIDLTSPVREAAILALPIAPLCFADCAGPAPDRFPTGPSRSDIGDEIATESAGRDPRWAALDALRADDAGPPD